MIICSVFPFLSIHDNIASITLFEVLSPGGVLGFRRFGFMTTLLFGFMTTLLYSWIFLPNPIFSTISSIFSFR